jgi:hypothetical protein
MQHLFFPLLIQETPSVSAAPAKLIDGWETLGAIAILTPTC